MSSTSNKKRFAGNQGFDSLLNVKHDDNNLVNDPSTAPTKKIRLVRTTHVLREDLLETFRDIAYWERRLLKDLMEEAMVSLIERYTSKNGPIKSRKV